VIAMLAPVAAAAGDIRDIRGPIVPPPSHAWWPYLVLVAAAVIVAIVVRAIVRRRRKPLSPDAEAIRALESARELIERGDPQAFGSRVSDAVRTYVERAFDVHAPRRTTDELLADLMTDDSPVASHRAALGVFLEFCDLAKYARWSLSQTAMTGMLDSAEAFVRATASPGVGP
jgi:hypothetical protein